MLLIDNVGENGHYHTYLHSAIYTAINKSTWTSDTISLVPEFSVYLFHKTKKTFLYKALD